MQCKLATWAGTEPRPRIDQLLRLITHPDWLAEAARITLSTKGAHTPGVDGVNKLMMQARQSDELRMFREELLSGNYQPLPARRVYIPKANGKQRPLGNSYSEGSYCSASHADGRGTHLGESFSFALIWISARTQCSPRYPHGTNTAHRQYGDTGTMGY